MEKQYKRTSRSVPQDVRTKISSSLKGRKREESEKTAISNGLRRYWQDDANFPDDTPRHEGTGRGWIESGDIV